MEKKYHICDKCNIRRNVNQFSFDKRTLSGLKNYCKKCELKIYKKRTKNIIKKKMIEGLKKCKKCNKWKNIDSFNKNSMSKDKLSNICKSCLKNSNYTKNPEYYKKNKQKFQVYYQVYYLKYSEKIKNQTKKYTTLKIKYNSKIKIREEIELYEETQESYNGNLMVKCAYCGDWFEPTILSINARLFSINNLKMGESRLYCSNNCKKECPTYRQHKYPKGYKKATSREVQPELRQMVLLRDEYTCQICEKHKDELKTGLHCHHYEGILWNPIESADIDACITLCKKCHKEVHKLPGCGYNDMKCKD